MLVEAATDMARGIGVPEYVIGLSLVAFGTSLPELVTSVRAATRGHSDIAIGNIVGSNVFNMLAVVGLALRERAKSRVSAGRIVFVKGPRAGDEVALRAGRTRIGALEDNDLVIPSKRVSRYHAELRIRSGRVHLWNLQARNLTYVNGESVETCELQSGDVITIGDAELRYER